jgi:hypothetical protein
MRRHGEQYYALKSFVTFTPRLILSRKLNLVVLDKRVMYHGRRKLERNQNVGLDIPSLVTIKINMLIAIKCMNLICANSWSHICKRFFFAEGCFIILVNFKILIHFSVDINK